MNHNFALHRRNYHAFWENALCAKLWIMMRDQNKCVMTLEMPRIIYWVEVVPYWKRGSLSGIQKALALTLPWMCVKSWNVSGRLPKNQACLLKLGKWGLYLRCNGIQLCGYLLIRNNVCLPAACRKLNSEDNRMVSVQLGDEGLHLILVGILEWKHKIQVSKERQCMYFPSKFPPNNKSVGI